MALIEVPNFVFGSNVQQSSLADQERTVNFYPERSESPGASSQWALYPTPGVSLLSTAANGPGSAHFFDTNTQREFAVLGTGFVEIDSTGMVQTNRGTVAIDANPATICSNGAGGGQLMVTSGGNVYIFTLGTNAFTQVASMNGKGTMGDQLDGYFIVLDAVTSTMFLSDLLDGTTWDPTQFAQRSIAADPWVAVKVNGRYIFLLGQQTSEPWYDNGSFPFPFVPYPGLLIPYGCAAPFSAEIMSGTLIWVTKTINGNGSIVRTAGFTPEQISSTAVEFALNAYSTISDAIGDSYDDDGHEFYYVTFPSANKTWCWDGTTQLWHERMTWIQESSTETAWRQLFHAFAFGQHRILDRQTGSVYNMSADFGTDVDSRKIRRIRRMPGLVDRNRRLFYGTFELDMEIGFGSAATDPAGPQVMLRMSDDGGKTFGNEQWRSAGNLGEYSTRVRWTRCGSARKRVFEIVVDDTTTWRLLNAYLEVMNLERRAA